MLIKVDSAHRFWSMRKNDKRKNKISKNLHLLQTPFLNKVFSNKLSTDEWILSAWSAQLIEQILWKQ